MKIITRPEDLAEFWGNDFVPTMGALHEGHLRLIDRARESGGPVVVSIFVNPKQFGPHEDLAHYPRPFEEDARLCQERGVDALFHPEVAVVYPSGFGTAVSVPGMSRIMCDGWRPGHFTGVCTVVARLLGLVRPHRMFMGWKDAQQYLILRRMVEDLALPVTVIPVETVREADGLALSSRNAYLSAEERRRAPALFASLARGEEFARAGKNTAEIVAEAKRIQTEAGFETQYVELRLLPDLAALSPEAAPASTAAPGGFILATAARLGRTRLIDNVRWQK